MTTKDHLLKARDIMTRKLVTLSPDTGIYDAIERLVGNRISGAPVVDRGLLVGILSEKDCLNVLLHLAVHELPNFKRVSDYMTRDVHTVDEDLDILSVGTLFVTHPFRRLPVVDRRGLLVGQISRRDVLAAIPRMRKKKSVYPDYRRPT